MSIGLVVGISKHKVYLIFDPISLIYISCDRWQRVSGIFSTSCYYNCFSSLMQILLKIKCLRISYQEKIGEKSLNCNRKTGEKNRMFDNLLGKKPLNLERKTRKKNRVEWGMRCLDKKPLNLDRNRKKKTKASRSFNFC